MAREAGYMAPTAAVMCNEIHTLVAAAYARGVEDAVAKIKALHDHECSAAAHHAGHWQPAYEHHMTRQAAISYAMQAIRNRSKT